jgi:hypothetical protein
LNSIYFLQQEINLGGPTGWLNRSGGTGETLSIMHHFWQITPAQSGRCPTGAGISLLFLERLG